MIAVIRISGQINISEKVRESLNRINIRKKYSTTLLQDTADNKKLLKKIRDYVAFGTINEETLKELIEKRASPIRPETKINVENILSQLNKKSLKELGIKPFFRLHPPRKGIESKKHFGVGKGVLGDNQDKINDLIRRML